MAKERNLILVHQPHRQDAQDFYDIAALVEEMAPDIGVHVVFNSSGNILTRKKAAKLPTLVFSPGALDEFRPERGKIYAGHFVSKSEQMQRLERSGVRVPQSVCLGDDPAGISRLTDIVLVKADEEAASRGKGIRLRSRVALEKDFFSDQQDARAPFLVQSFIDTGRYPSCYRVHTLFGETLFAFKRTSRLPGPTAQMDDKTLRTALFQPPAGRDRDVEICREPDVLDMAWQAWNVIREIPLQGCDIVRDAATGRLYILEINGGGNTWIFSKAYPTPQMLDTFVRDIGCADLTEPFDAFRTAARVLVERTRAEAE